MGAEVPAVAEGAAGMPQRRDGRASCGARWQLRWVLWGAPALAVCIVLLLSLRPAPQPAGGSYLPAGLAIGLPAPDFTLRDLQGRPWRLSALRGHAVLLNFWATYCPPCRQEMPALERAARHYRALGRQGRSAAPLILGIDAGGEDRATVAGFARQVGVTYPLLLDPELAATLVAYHVPAIPLSIVLDARGLIHQTHLGALRYADAVAALDAAR